MILDTVSEQILPILRASGVTLEAFKTLSIEWGVLNTNVNVNQSKEKHEMKKLRVKGKAMRIIINMLSLTDFCIFFRLPYEYL